MKAPRRLCVAVRRASGGIVLKNDPFTPLSDRWPLVGWPFLRGPVVLGETLVEGLKALSFSARQAMEEEGEELGPWAMVLTMLVAVGGALALFVALPHLITFWLGKVGPVAFSSDGLLFHLVDGIIKVVMFVAYLWLIGQVGEIRRVFAYHGAEHKSIHCLEAGDELTVSQAQRYSCLHPRCGTAFLLVVLVISIMTFTMVFPFLPRLAGPGWLNQLAQIGLKFLLMLPIAGVSYELIRLGGKKKGRGLWGLLLWPGLKLQRLTTREPSDEMVEIALCALKAALDTDCEKEASVCLL